MSYEDVLEKINDEKKKQKITNKLYRYSGLIHAIEFFSQRFNTEQILNYAYDFINELLIVDEIVLFYKQNDQYITFKSKGYKMNNYRLPYNPKYNNIATFHGHIMDLEDLENYLPLNLLSNFPCRLGVPLIIENELYGFILTNRFENNPSFEQEDFIIAEALMQLFNTSLYNCKSYQTLQNAKLELDEKVFNLFAINQSSKVLLSELNLSVLYELSIDVFSELTQSSMTSFFLYDEKSEQYVLRGMKDTLHPSNKLNLFAYSNNDFSIHSSQPILNMKDKKDLQFFNDFFQNSKDILQELKPMYIVLLIKNEELLGFVTLGEKVTQTPYNKGILELIESLASSTYIAISNANYFKQTNEQKNLLQKKFNRLVSLNILMKNINSASTVEELANLTLETLNISFGMKTGLFALFDNNRNEFNILKSTNMKNSPSHFKLSDKMSCLKEGEYFIINSNEQISLMLDEDLSKCVNKGAGALFVPICIEDIETKLLGVLSIFELKEMLLSDQENLLTVDTITNHIAPVLHHLLKIKTQTKLLSPNYEEIFLDALEKSLFEADELLMDLIVIHLHNPKFSFDSITISSKIKKIYKHIYFVTKSDVFIISFDTQVEDSINNLINEEYALSVYRYKEDFSSLIEFKKIFQQ